MLRRFLWLCVCLSVSLSASAQNADPIAERLVQMSLQHKVGQMFMFTFFGSPMNQPARALIQEWQVGAVGLFKSNLGTPEEVTRMTNSIQQALLDVGAPPAFIGVDQEGGIIAHLEQGFTRLPVPMLANASQDRELVFAYGQMVAREMRAVGINMNFAPVADLYTNRQNPIIGRRSWGAFPNQVAPMVTAYAQGLQAEGVLATVKHFPGHGDTDSDSHVTLPRLDLPLFRLLSTEFVPFQAAIDGGAGAVMVAHIYFSALEQTSDLPASLSKAIVTDLLRGQMGFEGIVMPDAMDMDAIDTVYSPAEAARRALEAGHDLIVLGAHVSPENFRSAMQGIVDAVQAGQIPEARIDASVARILRLKQALGVLDWTPLDAGSAAQRIDLVGHQTFLEELFAGGIALARDNAELVPVTRPTAFVYPASRPSLWRACQDIANLRPVGVSESPSAEEIGWALDAARRSERVIIFTLNADQNAQQQALVNALPPDKTLVIALWSPFDLLAFPQVAGYMLAYSPLPNSHTPLCAILRGDAPAKGQVVVSLSE